MEDLKKSLMNHGIWILAKQLCMEASEPRAGPGIEGTDFRSNEDVQVARDVVKDLAIDPGYSPQVEHLKSVFSFVCPQGSKEMQTSSFPRRLLTIDLSLGEDRSSNDIWNGFYTEFKRLPGGSGDFETFYSLYKKYAWYVPSSLAPYKAEGVSLFEQFKAIVALSHCHKRGGRELLLVGGDLPGIQSMLYTITSKGAAKSLRGRSFYLQLLCDILVQGILRELSLPAANVIYSAGGNFKVLASANDAEILQELRNEINTRLLDAHKGELFTAMDWVELDMDEVMQSEAFSARMTSLAQKISLRKRAWFSEHAKSGRYNDLFGVQGKGGPTFDAASGEPKNYCEVCQVDVDKSTSIVDAEDGTTKCYQCDSFEKLTRAMLDKRYFVVENQVSTCRLANVPRITNLAGKPKWEEIMGSLGYACSFEGHAPKNGECINVYRLNSSDFLPQELEPGCTYGFKFIGNVTPRMSDSNEIRDTTSMADEDATGIHRYGILRMDVDSLGEVFPKRLTRRDMLHTSALSAAISLFFEGWLNRICEEVSRDWVKEVKEATGDEVGNERSKLPYIIYSGGDDLFIVGTWDIMPILAERIRNDFASFVTSGRVTRKLPQNSPPCLTISAGISIFPAKFPIYQAADLAKEALEDEAKRRERNGEIVKDAVDFLDVTVGWEDFGDVKKMAFRLAKMVTAGNEKEDERERAPRALLTMLGTVAESYQQVADQAQNEAVIYGRWMWQLAYGLYQLKERTRSDDLKKQIMMIGNDALDLGKSEDAARWKMIKYLPLPVRWAEFLTRKGE